MPSAGRRATNSRSVIWGHLSYSLGEENRTMTINCTTLCHAINFMIWTSHIAYHLRDFTSCMEWYLVIESFLGSNHRQAHISSRRVHVCFYLHNLQRGDMAMLPKLFQKTWSICLTHGYWWKKQPGYHWQVDAYSGVNFFRHAIFDHGTKWQKVASGIYLPTLIKTLRQEVHFIHWRYLAG